MSWILHIETSTDVCSVALGQSGELTRELQAHGPRQHICMLSPLIDQLMSETNVKLNQLSAIAISSGPGSYTGLRVGYATAKGLCFALGIPLIDINTLLSLAVGMKQKTNTESTCLFMPMIDARRMEVYLAGYDQSLNEVVSPTAQILDALWLESIESMDEVVCFGGNGAFKVKSIESSLSDTNRLVFSVDSCNASYLVQPAWKRYQEKRFADLNYCEPFYLKSANITKPKRTIL